MPPQMWWWVSDEFQQKTELNDINNHLLVKWNVILMGDNPILIPSFKSNAVPIQGLRLIQNNCSIGVSLAWCYNKPLSTCYYDTCLLIPDCFIHLNCLMFNCLLTRQDFFFFFKYSSVVVCHNGASASWNNFGFANVALLGNMQCRLPLRLFLCLQNTFTQRLQVWLAFASLV